MSPEPVRQVRLADTATVGEGLWGEDPALRLGDKLAQRMSALIELGEFREGTRLPAESDLAIRFGVSRPVIREALSRLRVTGLIVSRKGSGSYVQKRISRLPLSSARIAFGPMNSLAQLKKCYEFRIGVEGDCAFYAAQNRTSAMLAAMRDALDRIQNAINQGVVGMNADFEFHSAVARASENEFYEALMESMRVPIEFAINLGRSLSLTRPMVHLMTVQAEHVAMFEAIEAHDRDGARNAMRAHIANACSRVFEGPGNFEAVEIGKADS